MVAEINSNVLVVDSYANGISIGFPGAFRDVSLRLPGTNAAPQLRRRYALYNQNGFQQLERELLEMSRKGRLSHTVVVLGVESDPFFPFDSAFSATLKFLELFERITPGRIVIQTRSPLIVIALPILQRLKSRMTVVVGVETSDDDLAKRYTPDLPLISERLKAMRTIRRFSIRVAAQIAPLLPYGEWRADSLGFAEGLKGAADEVILASLVDLERRGVKYQVAKTLASERRFHWLRDDAVQPLQDSLIRAGLEIRATGLDLTVPDRQLSLFGN